MEQFKLQLKKQLQEKLGDSYHIMEKTVVHPNDTILTGLIIQHQNSTIGATFYLENLLKQYTNGSSLSELVTDIISQLSQARKEPEIIQSLLQTDLDFETVKSRICFRLLNRSLNQQYLSDKVFLAFHDLAISFYLAVDIAEDSLGSISLPHTLFDKWNISLEELFSIAQENMKMHMPAKIVSLSDLLNEMYEKDEFASIMNPPQFSEINMYTLTSENMTYGAGCMLYDDVLKTFSQEHQYQKVVIIPSSIHETLLLSYDSCNLDDVLNMVDEVNRTTVSKQEKLSDNIYIYDSSTNSISMKQKERRSEL